MRLYLEASRPTDSVTYGFLPAAARLGLDVTVLTDLPAVHERAQAVRRVGLPGARRNHRRATHGNISHTRFLMHQAPGFHYIGEGE
jgi:hypothetical protein